MEEFAVRIDVDNGGTSTINSDPTAVDDLFSDVELYNEETGSSYELTAGSVTTNGNVTWAKFSDTNIDLMLNSGTTTFIVRADTAEDIVNFDAVTISMSVDVANDVKVVETTDDEEVTDKTPSSLSFDSIDGSET